MGKYKPDLKNARRHNDRNKRMIRESLEEVGPFRSIGVDGDGIVRAGNGVYEQAQALGLKVKEVIAEPDELVAVVRPDLRGKRAVRAALWDNRAGDTSDFDAAVLAEIAEADKTALDGLWDDAELAELIGAVTEQGNGDAEPQTDRAEELRQKWQTETGQLWRIGEHRLLCGDSTKREDVERVMGGEKANLIVTSPPYPGAEMWQNAGEMPIERISRLDDLNRQLLQSAWEITDESGVVCWNIADVPFGNHGVVATTTTTTTTACHEIGFLLRSVIIWDKGTPVLPPPAFMRRPAIAAIAHESVLVLYRGDWTPREKHCGIAPDDKQWLLKSVWPISTESAKLIGHKAPFPVELARRLIALWSIDGDRVLDLCVGSGTVLIACERMGRLGRGIELDPRYVAVALQRMSDAFPGIEIELCNGD